MVTSGQSTLSRTQEVRGVALHLLFEEYADRVVINDADPRMYCFWAAVTGQTQEFIEMVRAVPVSVDEWHRQRDVYVTCELQSSLELGFATFFLNRTGRSGIIHSGGPIGGYDQTGAYKIDARFNRSDLIRRIGRIGAYADRIDAVDKDGGVPYQGTLGGSGPCRACGRVS